MKLIFHPLTILLIMVGGFLVFVKGVHTKSHHYHESDVHGYVRQFCRSNLDACQRIVSDLE